MRHRLIQPSRPPLVRGFASLVLAFLVPALLWGCTALPDASPFASATGQLAEAVRTTGRTAGDDLATLPNGPAHAKAFGDAWAVRVATMESMTRYADSLVGIVDAANKAGASAEALATKVGNLATAAGIIDPALGPSVKVTSEVAKFVWANIALAKGASDMQKALEAAQPAIETIAETIAQDTKDIRLAVRAAYAEQERQLSAGPINSVIGLHVTTGPQAKAAIIDAANGPLTDAQLKSLEAIDKSLAATQTEYDVYTKQLSALRARRVAMLQLLGATDDALARWGAAHKSLLTALRERRPVSVESLADAVVEIRTLIKKVREL